MSDRKAEGQYRVTDEMLKLLVNFSPDTLCDLFNDIYSSGGHIPDESDKSIYVDVNFPSNGSRQLETDTYQRRSTFAAESKT